MADPNEAYHCVTYDLPAAGKDTPKARARAMNTLSARARNHLNLVAARVSASVYVFPASALNRVMHTVNAINSAYLAELEIDLLGSQKILVLAYDVSATVPLREKARLALTARLEAMLETGDVSQTALFALERLVIEFDLAADPAIAPLLKKAHRELDRAKKGKR